MELPKKNLRDTQLPLSATLDFAGGLQPPGGGNGRVAAGSPPLGPRSLTEEFNRASRKPQGAAVSPQAKQQVAELRQQMQAAADKAKAKSQRRSAGKSIASKQAIAELRGKMSQPKNTWELTPLGSVTRGYNPKRNRQLSAEIKRMETALSNRKGQAKAAFDRFASRGR